MKRKEAIKGTREGVVQIFNDYYPSTKEIKKFLKEAFPDDEYYKYEPNGMYFKRKYFHKYNDKNWLSKHKEKNLPIINLSTITKRKKTKLSQLEKQFSEIVKDVSELRQTLAKDVEVDVEEIQQETIKEEEIDFSVPQLVISKNENKVISITGEHNEDRFTGLVNISDNKYQPVNHYSKRWVKDCFKKFKGELTIK